MVHAQRMNNNMKRSQIHEVKIRRNTRHGIAKEKGVNAVSFDVVILLLGVKCKQRGVNAVSFDVVILLLGVKCKQRGVNAVSFDVVILLLGVKCKQRGVTRYLLMLSSFC